MAVAAYCVQRIGDLAQLELLVGIEGSAQRHIQQAVFRAGAGDAQRFVKALAQHGAEGERPAQIQDVALDGAALCQTGNGLVDHSLDRCWQRCPPRAAPWLMRGCTSLLANTPQREAMV